MSQHITYCRACHNSCGVVVEVENDRLSRISGDVEHPISRGYTCTKGRAQVDIVHREDRLLQSQQRASDGSLSGISSEAVMDSVADRLTEVISQHGPRAVAAYQGTMAHMNPLTGSFFKSFMTGIGSPMWFTSNTIDKPGRYTAQALMGSWMAPPQGYANPDAALLIGLNPFQSHYGVPCGHPGKWIEERLQSGMQLIVIDPRSTELARRATMHLKPVPGQDVAVLACLIHEVISNGLYDKSFVDENTVGLDELASVVRAFTPELVGSVAGLDPDQLRRAARVYATAGRGYAATGVGPSFSSSTTLVHYLVLALEALCGHYLQEGDVVERTMVFKRSPKYRAQASPPRPAWGVGEPLRVHSPGESAAGLPTGLLAEEILLGGQGQVRALLSCGGNPVSAWPDQLRTVEAMKNLDLLVQLDPWISATARYADYVVAPKMSYEVAGFTRHVDMFMEQQHWYGPASAYAQYTPPVLEAPPGSDLLEEWEFFYGVAQRMGVQLDLSAAWGLEAGAARLDMTAKPDSEELIALMTSRSRVPLSEVKAHPHGSVFRDSLARVEAKDPGWTGRLQLADPTMMADLETERGAATATATSQPAHSDDSAAFPFLLIGQRVQRTYNSSYIYPSGRRGLVHNPAHVHPDDLEGLGLASGDMVRLRSSRASISAIVEADASLRRGVVAMAHCFGGAPDDEDRYAEVGSPTNRLLDITDLADRYIGMPRMGATPIRIERPDGVTS